MDGGDRIRLNGIPEAATVDQDQPPDKHMQEREAEKTADLESLALGDRTRAAGAAMRLPRPIALPWP
jgi:hypothetical protein